MSNGFISTGGVHLHYEDHGSGTPVVLLHGFSGSVVSMRRPAAPLSERHRVVSIDLVGHGRSAKPDAARYSFEAACAQVIGVTRALGLEPFHLAGYSMGGRIALSIGATGDARLRSVVSISASPGLESADDRAERRRADAELAAQIEERGIGWFERHWSSLELLRPRTDAGREAAAIVAEVRRANDAGALAAALRGLGPGSMPYLGERLAGLGVPALLIAGGEDAPYCEHAGALAKTIPDARRVVIPGAGHSLPTDAALPTAEAMLSFFAEVETRAAT